MAKRVFGNTNWTPTATPDTTALANATYQALKGGSATQRNEIEEVYMAGMAGVTSPTFMQLALSSTVATTPTALAAPAYDGAMDPASAALAAPPVTFTAAATGGQRSAVVTSPRLNLGLNAYGGIVRWVAAPYERFIVYGNTTTTGGEAYLSAFTGGTVGPINSHIVYEPL